MHWSAAAGLTGPAGCMSALHKPPAEPWLENKTGEIKIRFSPAGQSSRLGMQEWKSPYMLSWTPGDVDELLTAAIRVLLGTADHLRLPVKVRMELPPVQLVPQPPLHRSLRAPRVARTLQSAILQRSRCWGPGHKQPPDAATSTARHACACELPSQGACWGTACDPRHASGNTWCLLPRALGAPDSHAAWPAQIVQLATTGLACAPATCMPRAACPSQQAQRPARPSKTQALR